MYFTVESYVELRVEIYESFEELKYRLFKMFSFPSELLPRMAFYEVVETPMLFDETFIEEFVRVSDFLTAWEVRKQKDLETHTSEEALISKLYLKFRYYLIGNDPKSILYKIEKCFLVSEFFRLIYSDKVRLKSEDFVRAIAMLILMRSSSVSQDQIGRLVSDVRAALKLYGNVSNYSVKINYKQVLAEIKIFENEKPAMLKNMLIGMLQQTPAYRTQFFRVSMLAETIKRYFLPVNTFLLIGPDGIQFANCHMTKVYLNSPLERIRQVLLNDSTVHIVFNTEEKGLAELASQNGGDQNTNTLQGEQTNEENSFVRYMTFSFTANQATVIYQTIQNYISLQMNGLYKVTKMESNRLYVDVDKLDITEEVVKLMESERKAIHNVNRFFKKEL